MTVKIVPNEFKLPGIDNYSLRQKQDFNTKNDINDSLNIIISKLDIIINLLRNG